MGRRVVFEIKNQFVVFILGAIIHYNNVNFQKKKNIERENKKFSTQG